MSVEQDVRAEGRVTGSAAAPTQDPGRPDDATLEGAVRGVPGIAEAAVRRDHTTGRTRLRLRLQAGQDRERVAWAVAAVLRERFGIALDPAAITPVLAEQPPGPPPPPTVGAGGVAAPTTAPTVAGRGGGSRVSDTTSAARPPAAQVGRVTISSLDLHREDSRLRVTVGLAGPGGVAEGVVRTLGTQRGTARAVAEATAQALARLLTRRADIAVDEVQLDHRADPPRITVALTLVADRDEEPLLGVAVVRDDTEHAVVRATLDALNRRVAPLLPPGGASQR